MKFPSIQVIASELRDINANVENDCDVRLQVYPDGKWIVRYGSSDYDQDHRGFWGASNVPGIVDGKEKRFNSETIAKDLIEQVKEQYAENPCKAIAER